MQLTYLNHEEFDLDTGVFSEYIAKLEHEIEPMEGILNVIFVNDTYIQALNKAYREKDQPTDVLSFNYDGDDSASDLRGEVYISVETAESQAKDHGHTFEDELAKLLIHGILHIHGYDHEEDEDYKEMYKVEKKVLGHIAGEFIVDKN